MLLFNLCTKLQLCSLY